VRLIVSGGPEGACTSSWSSTWRPWEAARRFRRVVAAVGGGASIQLVLAVVADGWRRMEAAVGGPVWIQAHPGGASI
jgi:hypothetical protein